MHCTIHIYVVHITLNSLFCIFMLVVGPFLGLFQYIYAVLRSRSNFGGSGSGSDPSKILRLRLRVIFKSQLIKNSKSWFFLSKMKKKWMIVLHEQNKNLKETWICYHILKNLLVFLPIFLPMITTKNFKPKIPQNLMIYVCLFFCLSVILSGIQVKIVAKLRYTKQFWTFQSHIHYG